MLLKPVVFVVVVIVTHFGRNARHLSHGDQEQKSPCMAESEQLPLCTVILKSIVSMALHKVTSQEIHNATSKLATSQ